MPINLRLHVVAVTLLALCAACGEGVTDPGQPPAPADGTPLASVQLVDRLARTATRTMPAVVGLPVGQARALLRSRGAAVQVLALETSRRIVAVQWPQAGAALSPGGAVLWTGAPGWGDEGSSAAAVSRKPALVAGSEPAEGAKPPDATASPQLPADVAAAPVTVAQAAPAPPAPDIVEPKAAPAPHGAMAGSASWYGPGFEGRQTACGDAFDPAAYTLASRELPCGTPVLVTTAGGRSVGATVTDWGPAQWTGRRFDLSRATFAAIANLGAGVIDVQVIRAR